MNRLIENLFARVTRRTDDRIRRSPFYRCFRPRLDVAIIDSRTAVSHEFRYAYFRVPKAANSTVVASLLFAESGILVSDLGELQVIKDTRWPRASDLDARQLRDLLECYFKFTFVRDPYTRVLAAFLDKVQRNEMGKRDAINEFLGRSHREEVSFEDFVAYLEGGGIDTNAHWARQVDVIPIPVVRLDFIGKMETLDGDLQFILTRLFGKQIEAFSVRPHATRATRDHQCWTQDLRRRVYRIYEPDFSAFRYPGREVQ